MVHRGSTECLDVPFKAGGMVVEEASFAHLELFKQLLGIIDLVLKYTPLTGIFNWSRHDRPGQV